MITIAFLKGSWETCPGKLKEPGRSLAALRGQYGLMRKVSRACFPARALLWEFLLFVAL